MPAQYQEQSQIGVWRANPSGKIMKRIQYARISEGLGILLMNTEAVNSKSAREVLKKFMNIFPLLISTLYYFLISK